jgi:hypothetical protein
MIPTIVLSRERLDVYGRQVERTPGEVDDTVVVVRAGKGAVPHVSDVSWPWKVLEKDDAEKVRERTAVCTVGYVSLC